MCPIIVGTDNGYISTIGLASVDLKAPKRDRLTKLKEGIRSLEPRQKYLAIVLIFLAVYGTMIALDAIALRPTLDQAFGPPPDLATYQQRASLVLNGGVIYRDLDIEAPPLIVYLYTIPQLMGGDAIMYQAWFSSFALFTSLLMYFVLRQWDDYYAFIASLVYLLSPFVIQDATWDIRDTPLVAFFVIAPILIAIYGYKRTAAGAVAVGFWTKFTPIILFPVLLIKARTRKEALELVGAGLLVSALIAIPFLLVCPIEFLFFPTYYLLARPGEAAAGQSVLDLLSRGGLSLPGAVGFTLTVAVLALCYIYAYKKKLDLWRSSLLVLVGFLSVYAMVRSSYYMFPWAFLCVWAASSKKMTLRMGAIYVLIMISAGFEKGIPGFDYSYSWLISLVFMVAGTLVMIDCAIVALRERCFLDRPMMKKEKASRGQPIGDDIGNETNSTNDLPAKRESATPLSQKEATL